MRLKGVVFLFLAIAIIGFLAYVVVAGLPWLKGTNILPAKQAIRYGLDLRGGVTITYAPDIPTGGQAPTSTQMDTVVRVMRSRLDAKGYLDANVTTSQSNRVIVEIPNLTDPEQAVKELGQTALLELIDPQGQSAVPGQPLAGGQVILSGNDIVDATAVIDPSNNSTWEVNFTITSDAQKRFAEATGRLAPTHGAIAITLDRIVQSAPTVSSRIDSNTASITGNFDENSAKELAFLIKSGALPFKLTPVTTQYVGALLGQNALDISIKAGIIGFLLVALFMMIWYRVPGVAAAIALIGYISIVLFILARPNIFTGSKITLTLPGIAGIILSIGVAVDANVIIFERIKEELRGGKSLRAAIDTGFKRAWSAIRDANVTTIISSLVLWWLGTGPIKGFAITLIIGIIVSMLSAILITRFLISQLFNLGIINTRLYGYKGE